MNPAESGSRRRNPSGPRAASPARRDSSRGRRRRRTGSRRHRIHLGTQPAAYYKRAKASEIMFGDANYHREEITRKVVDGDED